MRRVVEPTLRLFVRPTVTHRTCVSDTGLTPPEMLAWMQREGIPHCRIGRRGWLARMEDVLAAVARSDNPPISEPKRSTPEDAAEDATEDAAEEVLRALRVTTKRTA